MTNPTRISRSTRRAKPNWRWSDLIVSEGDEKLSGSKIAALAAHIAFFIAFVRFQVATEAKFNETLWLVYGGFAIGHAVVAKTGAQVSAFKNRQATIRADNTAPPPNTRTRRTTISPTGAEETVTKERTKPTKD